MIHYQLRCETGHSFDGWFRDSAAFETQAKGGLVTCPSCGSTEVERALMAPALPRKNNARQPVPAEAPVKTVAPAPAPMPEAVRMALRQLRAEVEKRCDYVGPDFAEEARRIHKGESDRRGIYGETTPEQAEALADEGIDVARIPWVPLSDA